MGCQDEISSCSRVQEVLNVMNGALDVGGTKPDPTGQTKSLEDLPCFIHKKLVTNSQMMPDNIASKG